MSSQGTQIVLKLSEVTNLGSWITIITTETEISRFRFLDWGTPLHLSTIFKGVPYFRDSTQTTLKTLIKVISGSQITILIQHICFLDLGTLFKGYFT